MKVYFYILKETKELYAYTTDKALKNKFEKTRNMKKFFKTVKHVDEFDGIGYEFQKLSEEPIDNTTMVMTCLEYDVLLERERVMIDAIDYSKIILSKHHIKKKYLKAIDRLTNISEFKETPKGDVSSVLRVNELKLFFSLFRNTLL